MRFETPWALLLLLLIPALVYFHRSRRVRGSLKFPSLQNAAGAGRSWRQRWLWVPWGLRLAGIGLLILALARPQQGTERVRDQSRGVAIEMVVDHSGSMSLPMEFDGKRLNRLDVVKRVFEEFVKGNGKDLPGRPNDMIGMIAFSRYADTLCPLTLAHGPLLTFLEQVKLVQRRDEDGTSIGDALALAAARLKTAEETLARQTKDQAKDYQIKSKIIILLTDGQNNMGKRLPQDAAKVAAEWGIKIYTIGIGGNESGVVQTPFGAIQMGGGPAVDEATLKSLAETTGGQFRMAEDAESLRAIYKEINRLEKTEIDTVRYLDYHERFLPLALAALAMIGLEVTLSSTFFRRVP